MANEPNEPTETVTLGPDQLQQVVETVMKGLRDAAADGATSAEAKQAGDLAAQVPAMLASLLSGALKQSGGTDEAEVFQAALDAELAAQAPKPPVEEPLAPAAPEPAAEVVDLDAERAARAEAEATAVPDERADTLRDDLKQTFGDYFAKNVDSADGRTPDELIVDPKFLQDHGAALAKGLIGTLAQALFTEPVSLDVPLKDEHGANKDVKVKLDLGAFFKGLLPPEDKPKA